MNLLLPSGWGAVKTGLVGFLAFGAWVLVIPLLFLDSRARVFWIIWLAAGIFILLIAGKDDGGAAIATSFFSFVFLLFRKYRPFRYLTRGRQAALLAAGFVVLLVLVFFWRGGPAPLAGQTDSVPLLLSLQRYALASLRFFWFFSLFHLFFTARLHFMKLRPKLAVAAFFIAVVPILLILVLAAGTIFLTLGASHAVRARALFDNWASLATQDHRFLA